MKDYMWSKWRWDQLRSLGTNKLVQLTFLMPILGYFLLFGEQFNEYLQLYFDDPHEEDGHVRVSYWRVYFLYFGFCSLALASFMFSVLCPDSVKLHGTAYEFVEREERTILDYRIAEMRKVVEKNSYDTIQSGAGYPDYESVDEWVVMNNDQAAIIEQDDDTANRAARDLGRIKSLVRQQGKAALMTEYFTILKRSDPKGRSLVASSYGIGFALVLVPTVVVFGQVFLLATRAIWRSMT